MDKVKNTSFLKDGTTGAIVNSNQRDYNVARSRVAKQKMKDKKVTDLQEELVELKKDMANMLTLLKKR